MTDVNKAGKLSVGGNWVTPKVRLSFVHVFRPQPPMAGQAATKEPKYACTALFDKDADLGIAKKMAQDALVEKFGEAKLKDQTFLKRLRSPFRDQGEKSYEGYTAGCTFITATGKQRPGVVDAAGADIMEEQDIYSGCYGRLSLRAFAYDNAGNVGVAFGLQNVQKLADGEPLGGRSRPQDDFEPVAAEAGAAGETAASIFG